MALENHPASFGIVSGDAGGAGDDSPPAAWTNDGVAYELLRDAHGWAVLAGGKPLGRLEIDRAAADGAPGSWRVRDPHHDTLGVGASWRDWRDALLALIDYRDRRDG